MSEMLRWTDDHGSDRDLLRVILETGADDVLVRSASLDRLQRLERFGFSCVPAAAVLRWESTNTDGIQSGAGDRTWPEAIALPEGVAWQGHAGCFEIVDEQTAQSHLAAFLGRMAPMPIALLAPPTPTYDMLLRDAGLIPRQLQHACLLRPRLTASALPVFKREFLISQQDVDEFGHQSGDLNPLHFDDNFARSVGFEGRITHGMIFSGWLTRLLGQEYPGPGTIFLKSSMVFFAPIYPARRHMIRISTPDYDPDKQFYRIVAQALNEDGKHCVVAYSDVVRRKTE
ncbi:MaoC/PaaZ C-terminal domain-containing protein [Pseudoxanthomonas sp. CF125]|jgi:acyl dehydratase|uniref:MaoC/PaaZ C-terminal domain-containing protein n=1 Tax=Pseudoxanthomonas sp. CF125 TaxID=1855303 RepID=UPI00088F176D|nr:MaoC/PaaZ C-terminal domain-containing protein [Pseudoxanthomonas sp. CF125]SDQ88822.1 MaoC like domain-containing protein [Pseudoxanthomonas sp. CF125]